MYSTGTIFPRLCMYVHSTGTDSVSTLHVHILTGGGGVSIHLRTPAQYKRRDGIGLYIISAKQL